MEASKKKKKPPGLGERIKKDLFAFFSESTIPGFQYVVRGQDWFERITWVVFLVFAFSATAYLVYHQLAYWDSHPVETTIDEVGLPVDQLPFPAITVCDKESLKMPRKNRWMLVEKILNSIELMSPKEMMKKMYPGDNLKGLLLDRSIIMMNIETSYNVYILKYRQCMSNEPISLLRWIMYSNFNGVRWNRRLR